MKRPRNKSYVTDKKMEELEDFLVQYQIELNRIKDMHKAEVQVALDNSVAELREIFDKIEELKEVGYAHKTSIVSLRKILSKYEEGQPSVFAVVIDLMKGGVKTLAELCEASGLSAAQVSQFLQSLCKKGLVYAEHPRRGIKGRSYFLSTPAHEIGSKT